MEFSYSIAEDNSVTIFENDVASVTQPVSPMTGQPFFDYKEAQSWAESVIVERQSWYAVPSE